MNYIENGRSKSEWFVPNATIITTRMKTVGPNITQPIDPDLTALEQIDILHSLSFPNRILIEELFTGVDSKLGTMSNVNLKDYQETIRKTCRTSFQEKYSDMGVAAIKDYLRAKTVLQSLEQTVPVLNTILSTPGIQCVKMDTPKMVYPDEWGWRFAGFDLLMPNSQIVEYYLVIKEIQWAKRGRAHEDYARWRNRNLENQESERDKLLGRSAYEQAWNDYLVRKNISNEEAIALWQQVENILLQNH